MKHVKLLFVLILLFVLVLLCACSASPNTKLPQENDFSLTVKTKKEVFPIGEEIKVEGILQNLTNSTFELKHTGLIGFSLIDAKGKQLKTYSIPRHLQYKNQIEAGGEFHESQLLSIDQPGEYQIIGFANFAIQSSAEMNYTIIAKPIRIVIVMQSPSP